MKFKIITLCILFWQILFATCYAYDVVFIGNHEYDRALIQQVKFASQLYGINTKFSFLEKDKAASQLFNIVKSIKPDAVIVSANTITSLKIQKQFTTFLNREIINKKILITGISPSCNPTTLHDWSQGKLIECKWITVRPDSDFYQIGSVQNITDELSCQTFPLLKDNVSHLVTTKDGDIQSIIDFIIDKDSHLPLYAKAIIGTNEIFFSTNIGISDKEIITTLDNDNFISIAPLLIFLRYSLGARCWHSSQDYANLTIDDPWLVEPYGYLRYHDLLYEMERENFHTTIAFIPWNFDRSEKEVIELFHNYPKRFSVCIHGNNHDHREFYEYDRTPLNSQESDIRQALARMESFSKLTKIPYARVMIFPHNISPTKTLRLLKKYNFMATINSSNLPLGSQKPQDPIFNARPITMNYETFPSIRRYSADRKPANIAIDLFLDNPLFFRVHQNDFSKGIGYFNNTASIINKIQPKTLWKSVGQIIQQYHLKKLRDDGNYDVEVFSNDFILSNKDKHTVVYHVLKKESFLVPIQEVSVDGEPKPYSVSTGKLKFDIPLKKGEAKHILITYENNLNIASIDITKKSFRVYLIRTFSDFRDRILSKTFLGNKFIELYYDKNMYKLGLIFVFSVLIVFIIIIAYFTYRILLKRP